MEKQIVYNLLPLSSEDGLPKEGTEPTETELLKDIKSMLEDFKKEREEAKATELTEVVTTDDQLQIMKQQLAVQNTQLAWVQMIICLGAVYVIARGFYKLIASYLY